ncbi:MAG: NifU family protein [Magnetospiraceae bacterium]
MFIQTEATPNPATIKFVPGRAVMDQGTANFTSSADAARSPLAATLFALDNVAGVFLGADFISVTKADDGSWDVLKPQVLGAVMEHFTTDKPVIAETAATEDSGEDSELVSQIKELLETRVRPAVAADGGDIVFHEYKDGIVYLQMMGSCHGCPSSTATLKMGIERMLRYYIPEVQEVQAVM